MRVGGLVVASASGLRVEVLEVCSEVSVEGHAACSSPQQETYTFVALTRHILFIHLTFDFTVVLGYNGT